MAKSLYGAYTAAGKAGGAYKASLYDIEAVGYEKEHSRQMYQLGEQKRERVVGFIQEGISLASNIRDRSKSKKKEKEAKTEVQESIAKESYGQSIKGVEGAKTWEDLSETDRSSKISALDPQEKGRTFWEKLSGEEKQYRFGKKVEGEEGQDLSEYYSKSEILAEGTLSKATRLSKRTGSYIPPINLGFKEEEKKEGYQYTEKGEGSEGWFKDVLKTFKSKNQFPKFTGTMGEKYNEQLESLYNK